MSEPTRITRTIDTDLPLEQLWRSVSDGASWPTWMVDEGEVVVAPGAGGSVVDDGIARTVRVDRLEDDRVGFTWWPDDRPDLASTVELVVLPAPAGSRLRVTETFAAAASASAPLAWDVRLLLLVAQALAVHV